MGSFVARRVSAANDRAARCRRLGGRRWCSTLRRAVGTVSVLTAVWLGGVTAPAGAAATWPFDALPVGSVAMQSGDLGALVDDLAELMPQRDSLQYRHPKADESARLTSGVALAYRGLLSRAARTLAPLGYRVVRYHDRPTGRRVVVLAQGQAQWANKLAWGVYVLDRAGARLMVQAPHPRADVHSERVAVGVFRRTRSRALLVASAHRYAFPQLQGRPALADVAHQRASAFHAVHVALRSRGLLTVAQPHGFGGDGPDAIVSSGTATASNVAQRVHEGLIDAGFTSCLYGTDGCWRLGATSNVQGQDTRQVGGEFVHIELGNAVRTNDVARADAERAIAVWLIGAAARGAVPAPPTGMTR